VTTLPNRLVVAREGKRDRKAVMRTSNATLVVVVVAAAMAAMAAADDGGVKEAIQDLYAKITTSESGGRSSAIRLDDATLTKAKYVSESLRRMFGGDGRTADRGGGGTDVTQTDDRSAESAADGSSGPPTLDVEAIERRFFDVIEQFERYKKSSSTPSTTAGENGRGTLSTSRPGGLFNFPPFAKKRVSSTVR